MKCQQCGKEIIGRAIVQHFDVQEPTTIHVFCSEKCKKSGWLRKRRRKNNPSLFIFLFSLEGNNHIFFSIILFL